MLHDPSVLVRAASRAKVPLVLAVLCGGLSSLAAQLQPVYTQPGAGLAKAQTMHPFQDALVFGANKTAWQLVGREINDPDDRRLSLFKSTDGGNTWSLCMELPTVQDGRGSIAMGADCKTLSVVWDARDTSGFSSVYYGEVDTSSTCPIALNCPTTLATGTASSDFWAMDVESTLGGRVAVIYMRSYTGSQDQWFLGNWSSTIRVKQPGTCNPFGAGQAINTGAYAVNANMVAIGDDVHIVYRTSSGGYGICYRGFDTRGEAFFSSTPADVPIGPNANLDMHASNVAVIATNSMWAPECKLGCLHVVYATGDYVTGNGKIWHAWANVVNAHLNASWTQNPIVLFPELLGGNQTYYHYTLATGENGAVYAVWKKKVAGVTEVWSQGFGCGPALAPQLLFSWSSDDAAGLNGHRGSNTTAKPHFMISLQGTPLEGVLMWRARGSPPVKGRARTVAYGRTCELVGKQPTLRSRNTPTIGAPPLVLETSGFVNSFPAVLMAGTACISSSLGSCWILQNMMITFAVAPVTGCGQTVTSIVVPNDPSLVNACLYFQAAQYAPPLNPNSFFILTNGLLAILDQ